jgi:hypothetical protein
MFDGWVVWEDGDAWLLCSGKIDCNDPAKANAQELPMIQLLKRDAGPLVGLRAASTASPRPNGLQE